MTFLVRIASLFWLLLVAIPSLAAVNTFRDEADSLINEVKKALPNHGELAIGIVKNGNVSFLGFRREGKKWVEVDNRQSVFEIGSITKVFTSVLLAQAVADNELDFTTAVTSITPLVIKDRKGENQASSMPLVSLANHTSGLPRLPPPLMRSIVINQLVGTMIWPYLGKYRNPYKGYSQKKFERHLKRGVKLRSLPGTTLHYSNWGMAILGYILEDKWNTNYETLLQDKIFKPMNMTSSSTNRSEVAERLVRGRNSAGRKTKNWDLGAMKAAGAVLSTTEDLVTFALANFEPDSLLARTRNVTFSEEGEEVALGWFIKRYADGQSYAWHNGGTGGYCSSMAIDTQKENAVVLLTNIGEKSDILDKTCLGLMELLAKASKGNESS